MSRTFCKMQGAKSKLQQVTFSCDLIAVGIKRLLTCFRSLQMNRKKLPLCIQTSAKNYNLSHVIILQQVTNMN